MCIDVHVFIYVYAGTITHMRTHTRPPAKKNQRIQYSGIGWLWLVEAIKL